MTFNKYYIFRVYYFRKNKPVKYFLIEVFKDGYIADNSKSKNYK